MACLQFEDLLVDYQELGDRRRQAVDAHLAVCAGCRAFQETLGEMDSALTAAYSGIAAPATLRVDTRTAVRPPSFVPELLDLAGGAAVIAVALLLLEAFLSGLPSDIPMYWFFGALFFISGLLLAHRSYAALR